MTGIWRTYDSREFGRTTSTDISNIVTRHWGSQAKVERQSKPGDFFPVTVEYQVLLPSEERKGYDVVDTIIEHRPENERNNSAYAD